MGAGTSGRNHFRRFDPSNEWFTTLSGALAKATPKSVREQDVIRFFPGEDVQTLSLSNLGDGTNSGGGILLWEAVWIPTTDTGVPEPWKRY